MPYSYNNQNATRVGQRNNVNPRWQSNRPMNFRAPQRICVYAQLLKTSYGISRPNSEV